MYFNDGMVTVIHPSADHVFYRFLSLLAIFDPLKAHRQ
jgi:hypothetical protein